MLMIDRLQGTINTSATEKQPCRAATTGNITLSGTQTVDGVTLAGGERVLVRAQSDAKQNGIYIYQPNTDWQRAADWDGNSRVRNGTGVIGLTP